MRLNPEKINLLKHSLSQIDAMARSYLFGSRFEEDEKGGDIDLLSTSSKVKKADIRKLLIDFCQNFSEQKIDILIDDCKQLNPFIAKIREQAIEL